MKTLSSFQSFVLLAAICFLGSFLASASWSNEATVVSDSNESGRYQFVAGVRGGEVIFDTKTARFWLKRDGHTWAEQPSISLLKR